MKIRTVNCDLCGAESANLINLSQNKNDQNVGVKFIWSTRKKNDIQMELSVVCTCCFNKMIHLTREISNLWYLYNTTRICKFNELERVAQDCHVTYQADDNFAWITDPLLRNQIENSIKVEGCTQVEWLQDSDISSGEHDGKKILENKSSSNLINIQSKRKTKRKSICSSTLTSFAAEFITETENDKVLCTLCDKVLSSSKDKVNHIRLYHLHERPFPCQVCTKRFTTRAFLNHHVKVVHGGRYYLCQKCGKKFKSRTMFKIHENKHLGGPKYKCSFSNCNKMFYGQYSLNVHIKGCHSDKKHICELCGKTFTSLEKVKIHSRRHFTKTVKCSLCPLMFYTRSDLGPHMKHHRTWPWKCFKCNMSFKSTRGLQQHFSATHGEKLTRNQLYKATSANL